MASNFAKLMASASKHAVAGSTNLLATNYGKHIYNVKISKDLDNGSIITLGKFAGMEYYEQGSTAATFGGTIIGKAANGNFYVRVTEIDDNTVLVLTTPLLYEEYTTKLQEESQFYNAKDDIVRAYGLAVNDIFELSAEGFDGTPEVDKTVTVNSTTYKLTVGA